MKHLVGMALCGMALVAGAQQGIPFSFGGGQPAQQAQAAAPASGDVVKVVARGVGATEEAARSDAFRDAIERAVGLYVDAEAMAQNDEVVQDQVLTHSNAYITQYDLLGAPKRLEGGLVQVRLVATVQKQKLAEKLKGVMPTQNIRLDGFAKQINNQLAQAETQQKQMASAKALLENALKDLDPVASLMVADLDKTTQRLYQKGKYKDGDRRLDDLPAGKVALGTMFSVKVDEEKYFKQFVPQLQQVLDQIALAKGEEIRLTPEEWDAEELNKLLAYLKRDDETAAHEHQRLDEGTLNSIGWRYGSRQCLFGARRQFGSESCRYWKAARPGFQDMHVGAYRKNREWSALPRKKDSNGVFTDGLFEKAQSFTFTLVTGVNRDRTMWKARFYRLDAGAATALYAWLYGRRGGTVVYNVVFTDGDGDELFVYEWRVPRCYLMNVDVNDVFNDYGAYSPDALNFYAAPFVGCAAKSIVQWRDIMIDAQVLAKVKGVKIEYAQ